MSKEEWNAEFEAANRLLRMAQDGLAMAEADGADENGKQEWQKMVGLCEARVRYLEAHKP